MNDNWVKAILGFVFGTALLIGCSKDDAGAVAAQAAKQYYDYLLEGKYEAWVDGHYQPERIPDEYREQLIVNAGMFMRQQQREHRGIHEVRIASAKADTARHVADVFMVFVYGDSTHEETLVPMVEHEGLWYMK